MRSSIDAQSCASVPPRARLDVEEAVVGIHRDWRTCGGTPCPRRLRSSCVSVVCRRSPSVASSSSSRAMLEQLVARRAAAGRARSSVPTVPSSALRSLPSSCARWGSLQMSGSSVSVATSVSRFFFWSKSKIPPQLGGAARRGRADASAMALMRSASMGPMCCAENALRVYRSARFRPEAADSAAQRTCQCSNGRAAGGVRAVEFVHAEPVQAPRCAAATAPQSPKSIAVVATLRAARA